MRQYKRGEIWWVRLSPSRGREKSKMRPCVIISSDSINHHAFLRIIVPLTTWQDVFSKSYWMIKVERSQQNGLENNSAADAFQVRCVDANERFGEKIGNIEDDSLKIVVDAAVVCIEGT